MNKILKKKAYIYPAAACGIFIISICCFYLFGSISKSDNTEYLYIDNDDNIDSVSIKMKDIAESYGVRSMRILARHSNYDEKIRPGRYALEPGMGALTFFRHLRNGHQAPVSLTTPNVRTKERLAEELGKKLMMDSNELLDALNDSVKCASYGYTPSTIISIFIPNTYEVYWNISVDKLLERMKTESEHFWNNDRKTKAKNLNLSPVEVITLASIIDEETANNGEKPMIAGMYYNRLMKGMPLQADPTIKFALQDFDLKRIYTKLLNVSSPYNTYKNIGLPPGPIRVASIAGIDAVLNMVEHDYLYMCAKEDFSGTHNFAETYSEHLKNAAKYSKALDERGIH